VGDEAVGAGGVGAGGSAAGKGGNATPCACTQLAVTRIPRAESVARVVRARMRRRLISRGTAPVTALPLRD
jgi:hypothetical protein